MEALMSRSKWRGNVPRALCDDAFEIVGRKRQPIRMEKEPGESKENRVALSSVAGGPPLDGVGTPQGKAPAHRQNHLPGERLWEGRTQQAEVGTQLELSGLLEVLESGPLVGGLESPSLAQGQTQKLKSPPTPGDRVKDPGAAVSPCSLPVQVLLQLPRPRAAGISSTPWTHHPPLPAFQGLAHFPRMRVHNAPQTPEPEPRPSP